ncbi:MAG: DUF4330 family protein [Ruminococcaceae bacterium]|nr:DUF4330 family protein [Oscillospiraceae bacterium]
MKRMKLKRLSYLDYVIIALLACFVLSLFSRYVKAEKNFSDSVETNAEIYFEVHGASAELVKALQQERTLFFSDGADFGNIMTESLRSNSAELFVTELDGRITKTRSASLYDLFGVISVTGEQNEGGFFVNGAVYIAPNMTVKVKNALADLEIFIVNVDIF